MLLNKALLKNQYQIKSLKTSLSKENKVKLKDKVVVVTGSTRGIGRAIAEACAAEGASVVISSRQESAVKETVETLRQQGFQVSGIVCDVAADKDLDSLLRHAIQVWGKIDVWINNAGLPGGYRPLEEMSSEQITDIVKVNLTALIKASKLVIEYFIERNGGILLNMSGKGYRGDPSPYTAVYASTKAAVTSLTRSLAAEHKGQPLSINAIVPGMVETDFYKDVKLSLKLTDIDETLPYILNAFGVPLEDVGRFCFGLAAQEPGKTTGKVYSILKGKRLLRAIGLMLWYRLTGKIKHA